MSASNQGYQVVVFNYVYTGDYAGSLFAGQLMVTDAPSYTASGVAALPILSRCFLFQEAIFDNGTIFGKSSVGVGDIEVDNTDGYLDSFRFYGFDGQGFKVYQIQSLDEALDDDTNLIFTGTLDYPEFELKQVIFHCKNRLQEWDIPVQSKTFSGGLPDDLYSVLGPPIEYVADPFDPEATPPGYEVVYSPTYDGNYVLRLEGEESLAGKKKPMIFGRVLNAPAICVNSSKSIYAFNYDTDGFRRAVSKFNRICDKGTDILIQSDVATAADIFLATPSPGYCVTCLAEGLVIFGSIPLGDVTADIDEAPIQQCTAAQVCARMLTTVLGFDRNVDFSQGELDALDVVNPSIVGVYLSGDEKVRDVIVGIISSIGGWVCPDKKGLFRFGRIDIPDPSASVATFTNDHILKDSLQRPQFGDENRGIPPRSITIKHSKSWAVLSKGQTLESVDQYIRTFMANEYRTAISNDPGVLSLHPSAPQMSFETYLVKGQRALIRNWDFQLALGSVASPKNDWGVTAAGGSSATINAVNQLVLTPSVTNKASVAQTIYNPGQFSGGFYRFGFTCLDDNVTLELRQGLTLLKTLVCSGIGDYSFTLVIPESFPNINLRFINTNLDDGSKHYGIIDNVYMLEILTGLTPTQEAARRMTILQSNFERFQFMTNIQDSKAARVGDVITLKLDDRFGFEDGATFRVVGKTFDTDNDEIEFDVVGSNLQQSMT